MEHTDHRSGLIWAKWSLRQDGGLDVEATYDEAGSYSRRQLSFESLDAAAAALGSSFRDVVERVTAAGHKGGRWRP